MRAKVLALVKRHSDWRSALAVGGVICTASAPVCALLIRSTPEGCGLLPDPPSRRGAGEALRGAATSHRADDEATSQRIDGGEEAEPSTPGESWGGEGKAGVGGRGCGTLSDGSAVISERAGSLSAGGLTGGESSPRAAPSCEEAVRVTGICGSFAHDEMRMYVSWSR